MERVGHISDIGGSGNTSLGDRDYESRFVDEEEQT